MIRQGFKISGFARKASSNQIFQCTWSSATSNNKILKYCAWMNGAVMQVDCACHFSTQLFAHVHFVCAIIPYISGLKAPSYLLRFLFMLQFLAWRLHRCRYQSSYRSGSSRCIIIKTCTKTNAHQPIRCGLNFYIFKRFRQDFIRDNDGKHQGFVADRIRGVSWLLSIFHIDILLFLLMKIIFVENPDRR